MVTAYTLKLDLITNVNIIKPLIDKIGINETFPKNWKEDIIINMLKQGNTIIYENAPY